jgi:3-hydroxy acid dehydrogenase / malonic semialdehyde reductase
VRVISEGLKQDLLGTPARVSSVDPGLVETEFSQVRFHGDADRTKTVYVDTVPLTAQDVVEVVLFCATRSAHVKYQRSVYDADGSAWGYIGRSQTELRVRLK